MKQVKKKQVVFSTLVALACAGHIGYASNTATTTENGVTNNYWDITINNVSEDHGLELGTNTRARGNGSIATGKNSVAIGNNAVATGGNETKDSITSKLNENKQKLADIANAENKTKSLLNELQTIRKKEADVLEAGERVKQVKRAKATAYERYQDAQKKYEEAKAGAADFLKATQAKIDDFNSRLSAVNKLGGVDINSEQGLTNAATQFKQMVEQGTTLNLDMPFYKKFVKSHYQAAGDLRANKIRQFKSNPLGFFKCKDTPYFFISYSQKSDTSLNINIINPYSLKDINNIHSGLFSYNGILAYLYHPSMMESKGFNKNAFDSYNSLSNKPDKNIIFKNINTDLSSEAEYESTKEEAVKYKQSFREYFNANNNPLLTTEIKNKLFLEMDKKIDYEVKAYEITYYQKQYEDTHNTTWLDKKNTAIQEYNSLAKSYNMESVIDALKDNYKKWEKENITDIEEKNKITTATLTSELEKALQINKNAALDKEKEIENLKKAAAQALVTYNNTNPSDADIMMSQRYDAIMKELSTKANELKSEQERLQALKKALTLHDLTNVGENAIAVGTKSLATGTDSLAIGTSSVATGNNAIAIGKNTSVTATNSAAMGVDHIITGDTSSTLGYKNTIYGSNSYAIGSINTIGATSTKKGSNTFVLGNNISTTANNAVVLGANSTATEDNVVSIGAEKQERKIIHVADGTLSESSTDAVNGKQLYNAMQNAGKTYTAGSHIAISSTDEISVVADGTVADGNTGLVTGGTVYNVIKNKANTSDLTNLSTNIDNKLATKANIDASNINVAKFSETLGVGTVADGNTGLVTGGTVYSVIKDKANTSDITNLSTNIDNKLATKANIDASNINVTKFSEKLGVGTVADGNTGLVTGGTVYNVVKDKANTDLSNLSDTGTATIRTIVNNSISLEDGVNTTVSQSVQDNKTTYKVNVSNEAIQKAMKSTLDNKVDVTEFTTKLATKANIDASNINVTKFSEKLGVGTIADGNTGLVTGGTVYNVVKDKANTSDITNLSTNIDNKLATKANVDGSNINVTKFREKLGTGLVEEHNYNLVTGDTVFNAIKNLQSNPISTQEIMKNREDINYLKGETSHVGAISAALAGLHPQEFDDDYKFSIAAAQGTYNHASATALGAFYRPNEDLMFSVAGTVSSGNKAYNVGVSYKFGSSTQKAKKQANKEMEEMKNRMKMLEELVDKLVDENNHLKKLSTERKAFADIPKNHWAAEAVETLHANNILEGYPDGKFEGDRNMTRYEYAQMLYKTTNELTK